MKNKITLTTLTALAGFAGAVSGQTTVLNETFDDDSQFSFTSGSFHSDGSGDYLGLTAGDYGTGSAPSGSKAYTGFTGSYLEGQDLDGDGTNPSTIEWTGLSITGLSSIEFSGDFAEFFDSPGDIDEAGDSLLLEYQIDSGGFQNLLAFEGADFSSSTFNGIFREDTNFDGTGDGTALGDAATNFSKTIAGTGSTLDLRFTANVNSGDEDFGVDNFSVTAVPEPQTFALLSGFAALIFVMLRRRNA